MTRAMNTNDGQQTRGIVHGQRIQSSQIDISIPTKKTTPSGENKLSPSSLSTETESLRHLLYLGRMAQRTANSLSDLNAEAPDSSSATATSPQPYQQDRQPKTNKNEGVVEQVQPLPFLPVVHSSNFAHYRFPESFSRHYHPTVMNTMAKKDARTVSFRMEAFINKYESSQGTYATTHSDTSRAQDASEEYNSHNQNNADWNQYYPPNKKRRFQRRNSKCPSMFRATSTSISFLAEDGGDEDLEQKLPRNMKRSSPPASPTRAGDSKKRPISPWSMAA